MWLHLHLLAAQLHLHLLGLICIRHVHLKHLLGAVGHELMFSHGLTVHVNCQWFQGARPPIIQLSRLSAVVDDREAPRRADADPVPEALQLRARWHDHHASALGRKHLGLLLELGLGLLADHIRSFWKSTHVLNITFAYLDRVRSIHAVRALRHGVQLLLYYLDLAAALGILPIELVHGVVRHLLDVVCLLLTIGDTRRRIQLLLVAIQFDLVLALGLSTI